MRSGSEILSGVIHGARGKMRVLVIGIPDIADDDYFSAEVGDATDNSQTETA
jgi:hypothetical protein